MAVRPGAKVIRLNEASPGPPPTLHRRRWSSIQAKGCVHDTRSAPGSGSCRPEPSILGASSTFPRQVRGKDRSLHCLRHHPTGGRLPARPGDTRRRGRGPARQRRLPEHCCRQRLRSRFAVRDDHAVAQGQGFLRHHWDFRREERGRAHTGGRLERTNHATGCPGFVGASTKTSVDVRPWPSWSGQVLEISTLPGVENVALAPFQGRQRPRRAAQ